MGTPKVIKLRDREITVDYDGFCAHLKASGVSDWTVDSRLRRSFPEEHALAREKIYERARRSRWDAWFENGEHAKYRQIINRQVQPESAEMRATAANHESRHDRLMRFAAMTPGRGNELTSGFTVTDFSDWVYRIQRAKHLRDLTVGRSGEILVQKKKLKPKAHPKQAVIFEPGWKLAYFDDFSSEAKAFPASLLTIQGKPIYGRPDYVYMNDETATVLIVEIKTSNAHLPIDGWPNLRAQLWAYAHLHFIVERARNVILIGEVWWFSGEQSVTRRCTYRWKMSDGLFCKENEELFRCYQRLPSTLRKTV